MSLLTRGRRVRGWLLVTALTACVLSSHLNAQEAEGARQVLVLNSTRLDDQFSMTWARELPKQLSESLNQRVDFYVETFDFVRFPGPEHERAYLDFLQLKYAGKRVDLVVLIGAVAMDFMGRHRNVLFADTPAVFYSLSKTEGRLVNSTGLFNPLNFGRSIDLMLALQPDLERVYVVSGAGTADQAFERQARAEFRPFESRVAFTYFSGLAMSDLERRLKALPPRSAVYYVAVRQDLAGEQFQAMASLTRVAAAANAPTYSWADAAAETAIVGGSRRDQLVQTKAIAALALRVLRGERADDIPVSTIDTNVDQVDWRQLRRWRLDESRLPPGTRVLFREPSVWDRYRRYIIGAVVLMLAQTALITGLLVHRRMRRRVELELRDSEARLRVSYDRNRHLSRRLLGEQEAERARLARELHDDINQRLAILSIQLDRLAPDRLQVDGASRLSRAQETVHDISTSVRELSQRLHPAKLQLIGLVAGIDDLRRDLSPPHLPIAFSHRDVPAQIDQAIQLCVFRVAQEALWNAVRHSDAGRIEVELTGAPSSVALTITDDGEGFDADKVNTGLGLTSMRERVETVGGTLEIHTTRGSGTRVKVTVPIQSPEGASLLMSPGSTRVARTPSPEEPVS
jgi:signal transduction histidine kinase